MVLTNAKGWDPTGEKKAPANKAHHIPCWHIKTKETHTNDDNDSVKSDNSKRNEKLNGGNQGNDAWGPIPFPTFMGRPIRINRHGLFRKITADIDETVLSRSEKSKCSLSYLATFVSWQLRFQRTSLVLESCSENSGASPWYSPTSFGRRLWFTNVTWMPKSSMIK